MKSINFEVNSLIGKIIDLVSVDHREIGNMGAVIFNHVSPRIIKYLNMNRAF